MGDLVEVVTNTTYTYTPISELPPKEHKTERERLFIAAAERGEYPEKLFGTRKGAFAVLFFSVASLGAIGGMLYETHQKEEAMIAEFNSTDHDMTGWPQCEGRQTPWRNHCIEPAIK